LRHKVLRFLGQSIVLISLIAGGASAQAPKHEMRGAWITTVYGLDWPNTSHSSAQQISSLTSIFDDLESAGINAVFFQIRSEADALYFSLIEPASRMLTGTMGLRPDPYYDPLELAIDLAHERGMELHAWMNPFRAMSSLGPWGLSSNHIVNTRPDLILDVRYKGSDSNLEDTVVKILNPGIPEVREYISAVVEDVVTRYDVDGIHFDDYFYPYPSYQIGMEDQSTFATYGAGFLSQENWRRDNINQFVRGVGAAIRAIDPDIKYGISPFGIWRNGVPQGIVGLDAYNVIYSDPLDWLQDDNFDYMVPQLYWKFTGGQDFGLLADWWASQANGKHIYPGIAAYRADAATYGWSTRYASDEVPRQIEYSRATSGIQGNVFFRASNLRPNAANLGLSDALRTTFFNGKAFTPYMQHRGAFPPDTPENLTATQSETGVFIRWDPPLTGFTQADRFGVYRMRSDAFIPDSRDMTNDPANLIAISWSPEFVDTDALEVAGRYFYAVTGVDPMGFESQETALSEVVVANVGTEKHGALPISGMGLYPNPSQRKLQISGHIERSSSLLFEVYDVLGRRLATPDVGSGTYSPGLFQFTFTLRDDSGRRFAPGTYFMVVRSGHAHKSIPFTVVR